VTVFKVSRPWPSGRKRHLLSWLCDFCAMLGEGGRGEDENETENVGSTGEAALGPVLQGSVLTLTAGLQEGPRNLGQSFARLLAELPAWHEWAVSDAAHGGAEDEDAPQPPAKRRKDRQLNQALARVKRARADRTGPEFIEL